MKRILFIPGALCDQRVWNPMTSFFSSFDVTVLKYPASVLSKVDTVNELASWAYEHYIKNDYDVIIGHSMGGLVLAENLRQIPHKTKCILLETSLVPADSFYQTLLHPNHKHLEPQIYSMFNDLKGEYSPALLDSIQNDAFNFTESVLTRKKNLYLIYGLRESIEQEEAIKRLNLNDEILKYLHFHFIDECAHMPTLEQSKRVANILLEIIEGV